MTKQQFDQNMQEAKQMDARGKDGRSWLASKSSQELSDMKVVARINGLTQEIEYIRQVELKVQNRVGIRYTY